MSVDGRPSVLPGLDRMRMMRTRGFATLLLFTVLVAAGCRRNTEPAPGRLSAFEEDYFRTLFDFRPTLASAQGMHRFDGHLDNINPITVGRRIDELTRMLARLSTLRKGGLSSREKLDADLIDSRIRSELLDLKHRETWRHDPLLYLDIPLDAIGRLTRRRYESASTRLEAVILSVNETEAVMASMRANVGDAPPEYSPRAIEECERLQALFQKELPDWARQAAGVDMRLVDNFNQSLPQARRAVATSLLWLKTELPPSPKGSFALKREQFVMKLLFDGMVEIPLDRLLPLAEANLDRDHQQFVALAHQWRPNQAPAAVFRLLTTHPVALADRVTAAKEALAEIRDFLRVKGIVPLPEKLPVEIGVTPQYLATPLTPVMVDLPAVLGKDPLTGGFYLSPPLPAWPAEIQKEFGQQFTVEQIKLDVIHDLVPGVYLQTLHARQYPSRAGRLLGCRLTSDGWGAYAERMMIAQGYGHGDVKLRLTALQRALVRDCRLVAAIKLHTQGAGVEQMSRLFAEKAFLGPALAQREAVRGTYDPGYLSGALGSLLIGKLRKDYRTVKGSAFSLRKFHTEFLSQGHLPIALIRQALLPEDQAPQI